MTRLPKRSKSSINDQTLLRKVKKGSFVRRKVSETNLLQTRKGLDYDLILKLSSDQDKVEKFKEHFTKTQIFFESDSKDDFLYFCKKAAGSQTIDVVINEAFEKLKSEIRHVYLFGKSILKYVLSLYFINSNSSDFNLDKFKDIVLNFIRHVAGSSIESNLQGKELENVLNLSSGAISVFYSIVSDLYQNGMYVALEDIIEDLENALKEFSSDDKLIETLLSSLRSGGVNTANVNIYDYFVVLSFIYTLLVNSLKTPDFDDEKSTLRSSVVYAINKFVSAFTQAKIVNSVNSYLQSFKNVFPNDFQNIQNFVNFVNFVFQSLSSTTSASTSATTPTSGSTLSFGNVLSKFNIADIALLSFYFSLVCFYTRTSGNVSQLINSSLRTVLNLIIDFLSNSGNVQRKDLQEGVILQVAEISSVASGVNDTNKVLPFLIKVLNVHDSSSAIGFLVNFVKQVNLLYSTNSAVYGFGDYDNFILFDFKKASVRVGKESVLVVGQSTTPKFGSIGDGISPYFLYNFKNFKNNNIDNLAKFVVKLIEHIVYDFKFTSSNFVFSFCFVFKFIDAVKSYVTANSSRSNNPESNEFPLNPQSASYVKNEIINYFSQTLSVNLSNPDLFDAELFNSVVNKIIETKNDKGKITVGSILTRLLRLDHITLFRYLFKFSNYSGTNDKNKGRIIEQIFVTGLSQVGQFAGVNLDKDRIDFVYDKINLRSLLKALGNDNRLRNFYDTVFKSKLNIEDGKIVIFDPESFRSSVAEFFRVDISDTSKVDVKESGFDLFALDFLLKSLGSVVRVFEGPRGVVVRMLDGRDVVFFKNNTVVVRVGEATIYDKLFTPQEPNAKKATNINPFDNLPPLYAKFKVETPSAMILGGKFELDEDRIKAISKEIQELSINDFVKFFKNVFVSSKLTRFFKTLNDRELVALFSTIIEDLTDYYYNTANQSLSEYVMREKVEEFVKAKVRYLWAVLVELYVKDEKLRKKIYDALVYLGVFRSDSILKSLVSHLEGRAEEKVAEVGADTSELAGFLSQTAPTTTTQPPTPQPTPQQPTTTQPTTQQPTTTPQTQTKKESILTPLAKLLPHNDKILHASETINSSTLQKYLFRIVVRNIIFFNTT